MNPDSHTALMILLAIFLVLLNGFFVLSEFAIVKVRRSKLEELLKNGKSNADLALKMSNSLDTYLSATQLGITLSSLALGWIGEPALASLLEQFFGEFFGSNLTLLHTVSFIIAFTLITLLHVVFGELIPKSIAIAKAEQAALIIAKPLHLFWMVFYPLIKLFDVIAAFFLGKIGIKPSGEHDTPHSDEELKIIVNESLRGGFIDSIEGEIIKNAVNFSDIVAKEIMTPRKDMICLNAEDSYEENIQIVLDTRYTRYPYCQGNKDHITGIIHIRDLLDNAIASSNTHDLSLIVRAMVIVPENAPVSDILMQMNRQHIHTALVIDEYGGTAGLITMDDILEQVMGDICDEHDLKDEKILKIDDNTYEFSGMVLLEDVAEILHFELNEDEYAVTLGGKILNILGKLPTAGDAIHEGDYIFEVAKIDGNRITKVIAKKIEICENEQAE